MFVDEVDIHVWAGSGGSGCLSFRREKFIPRGGPDGGDGGHGGSVIIVATATKNTLVDFRFHPEFKAKGGGNGQGSNRTGQTAYDLEIAVPVGTLVFEKDPGTNDVRLLDDLAEEGQRVVVAKGGRAGRGNARFVSSTNRAPRRTEPGEQGEEKQLQLQLKLIADVGLIGFPNAGKSTLIARISAARPKIADYPFTTLVPNLGVVRLDDARSFVVADVPGLIKGAHEGHGLGHQFLRHIERTKVLVHLVDVSGASGRDPVEDFDTIVEELQQFSPAVAAKPQIVVASKMDAVDDEARVKALERHVKKRKLKFLKISAASGEGIDTLLEAAWKEIRKGPADAGRDEGPDNAGHYGRHGIDRPACRRATHRTRPPKGMTTQRRLGVLGGTFDPIHNGHLDAGEAAVGALKLDELLVIPSHDPPHRPVDPMASGFHRFAMVALAIVERPTWRLSDIELTRTGPSYTVHTLRALHADGWAPSQIFFILGADAFAEIATWHEFPDVLHDANFAIVARPGASTLEPTLERVNIAKLENAAAHPSNPTGFFMIDAVTPDVSSTEVRARLTAGRSIDDLVPASVARYIQANHLYDSSAVNNLHGKAHRIHR